MAGALRVGADVGGTFTDVLALDPEGRVRFRKLLSTPPDYGRAVLDAVAEIGSDPSPEFAAVVHGTTAANPGGESEPSAETASSTARP